MKLRAKLALTVIAVALPVVAGLVYAQLALREHLVNGMIESYIDLHGRALDRAQCEASPSAYSYRGDARGGLYPYAEDFTGLPDAPPLDDLVGPLRRDGIAVRRARVGGVLHADVIKRTPWGTGPCAYMLKHAVLPPPDAPSAAWAPLALAIFSPLVGIVAIVIALSPLLRRLRRISAAVTASSKQGVPIAIPVDGNDELDDLARCFDETARELRAVLDEQARREQVLRDFLSATTHDLRVPLGVLLGQLVEIRERVDGGDALVSDAVAQAHHIASLARNLGAATKLDTAPELEREAIDLRATVERCVARHRPLSRARAITIEHSTPTEALIAHVDGTLVEQAIGNVIENAIRYGNPGGHVAVVLHVEPRGFRLDVIDDGPGIDPADVASLVLRGARGAAGIASEPGGQGLGLSIAREVAGRHGWRMNLLPNAGGGLVVRFTSTAATARS